MKKTKDSIWTVKKMLDYAIVKYGITNGYSDSPYSQRANYERKIRRTLESRKMVERDEETDKYIHVLPEREAKYFIDVILRTYFEERSEDLMMEAKYAKADAELNENNYKAVTEGLDDYSYENGDPDPTPKTEEINAAIDRFMLRAIFEKFYSFNEEEYRKDYIKRPHLISDDTLEPILEGYSLLNEKLSNPVKYYCAKK